MEIDLSIIKYIGLILVWAPKKKNIDGIKILFFIRAKNDSCPFCHKIKNTISCKNHLLRFGVRIMCSESSILYPVLRIQDGWHITRGCGWQCFLLFRLVCEYTRDCEQLWAILSAVRDWLFWWLVKTEDTESPQVSP